MTDEYRDVPNGYVYLYEREGWVVVERGDYVTRIGRKSEAIMSARVVPAKEMIHETSNPPPSSGAAQEGAPGLSSR